MMTSELRQHLLTSDRTLYQIAKETGIDYSQLCGFCHGRRGLSLNAVDRLADVLGLRVTAANTGDDESDWK